VTVTVELVPLIIFCLCGLLAGFFLGVAYHRDPYDRRRS
jgi:hypothetical protein